MADEIKKQASRPDPEETRVLGQTRCCSPGQPKKGLPFSRILAWIIVMAAIVVLIIALKSK